MQCSVRLFGPFAQTLGQDHISVQLADAATVADLRKCLAEAAPTLAPMLAGSRIAVNHAFAREDQTLGPSDEIALIGLVSGG